jgi:hypothetical protein
MRGFRESAATVASRNAEIVRKANWEARKCRGEVQGEYRHHDVSATDKFRRAARYMEKVEGVSKGGAGREPTAFRLACRLRRGFDLTVNETLCLLERWNVNNDPPLPDSVLIAKAQQARDRGTEAIGGMLRVQAENVIITSEGVEIREDKVKPPSVLNSGRRLARYLRLLNSFAVNDPRRKRVSRNIACCKVFGTLVCKTHGPQGVKTFPCGSPSCSHCMTKRARAQRDHINKTWPEQVAVLEVETTLAEQNGLDSLGAARNLRIGPVRNAFRGGEGGMDHRWLIGTSRVVVFAGEDRIPLLRRVGKKLKAGHRKTRINVMPRWQAAQLVLRTWTEPSSELDALLDSDLPDDVVHGKLRSLKIWDPEVRIVRTRGNQGGEEKFPWLSLEAMTAELVERAKKRRGDLPWNKCAHVMPGGEHCCADLTCHLVIKQTGELIGEFDTDKAWELSRKALSFGLSASLDLANLPPP